MSLMVDSLDGYNQVIITIITTWYLADEKGILKLNCQRTISMRIFVRLRPRRPTRLNYRLTESLVCWDSLVMTSLFSTLFQSLLVCQISVRTRIYDFTPSYKMYYCICSYFPKRRNIVSFNFWFVIFSGNRKS